MEHIWMIVALVLALMFLTVSIYLIYYRMNIKHISKQLEEMLELECTNQLITAVAAQKDMVHLINNINQMILKTRQSYIKLKRMNWNFREGITNISHDLRTPLTTAGGYVQMLQSDVSPEEQEKYLEIVMERQNMVKALLEQLFEYVRLESDEMKYEIVPMDAKAVFTDILAMYYDDFYQKGQEPSVIMPDGPCFIQGDPQGVKRIFSNILFNAINHGVGCYEFEIREQEEWFLFSFSNLSEPMSNEDLERIFERFYTKDSNSKVKTSGLGLAIAKEITSRLDGKIKGFYVNGKFTISVWLKK